LGKNKEQEKLLEVCTFIGKVLATIQPS